MRKITVNTDSNIRAPSEPIPSEYKLNVKEEESKEDEIKEFPKIDIRDLERLSSLKTKLKSMSSLQKEKEMLALLNSIIDYLDDGNEIDKKEIVLFVMYKMERFILKRKAGNEKLKLATNILKPLFHNDEYNTALYIQALMHEHKQIKMWGRIGLRLWRYFVKNE